MEINTPLSQLTGIGPGTLWKLKRLGLETVADLIYHFPFRYEDYSQILENIEIKEGDKVTLRGQIWSISNIFTRSRKVLTQAIFNDGTTPINLTWFNQSWLTKQIKTGDNLQISGKVTRYKNKLTMIAPIWEKLPDEKQSALHTGKLLPIYPETEGLSSKWIRSKIALLLPTVLNQLDDPLPGTVKEEMLSLKDAIRKIHQPEDYQSADQARKRLGFDELFYIQLATQQSRMKWQEKQVLEPLRIDDYRLQIKEFINSLPYKLTAAQDRVIQEIFADLSLSKPMNRLVQGEVGSGKTVVAAVIAYLVYLNKLKTIYMAPTEILAFQHQDTLSKLLEPFGVNVGIYTGSKKKAQDADIFVGTHALLSDKLSTPDVGLIVIDEQQRFGVEQRTTLRSKAKLPHFLTMTATPIPRTVALTIYGDLDLSIIDELPKDRQKVKTYLVPKSKRADAYGFIRKHIKEGEQAYVITPLIEQSETLQSAKAAKVEFDRLSKEIFPDLRLGLLHGRLASKEKEEIINKFKDHKLDILVSTTVVEVGVDVPNTTIMVIEGAERFGLAQLHQLRGRVGRGTRQSFCLLFSEDPQGSSRLKYLETVYDGLKLSELDLKIRGSGEIFGTKQAGRFELKIASLSDLELIEKTRTAAHKLLASDQSLAKYPALRVKLSSLTQEVAPD